MKKFYFIAVLALAASAACTNIDPVETPDVKIGYQVANYMTQTKSGETSFLTELAGLGVTSNQAFKSSAFLNADDGNGGHNFSAFYPSNPETISWNTTSTEWEPSKDYYWPKSPKSNIDFFSWYAYAAGDPTLVNTAGTTATMTWSDVTIASKEDILFADVAFHQQKNSETYKLDGVSEGVPTLFRHALAQVKFTVKIKDNCDKKEDSKNSGKYTFWEVTLSDVAIAADKIHGNGTLTLSVTDPDANDLAASITEWSSKVWSNATTPAYINTASAWFTTDAATGAAALTTTVANLTPDTGMGNGYLAVRPQAIGNDVTLRFKMHITTKYGTALNSASTINTEIIDVVAYDGTSYDVAPNDIYTSTGIQLNKIGASPITAWEMNHKYVYNIVIDPSTTTILYDPAVEPWATESTVTQEVPGA